jgi:alternate signal-mediated exported protein
MKNSTLIKGSAAIALGAALLLGGGGTLANWNAQATTTPGTIVAGDLNVENVVAGVWTDRAGATIDITTYKAVPGDKLTFKQNLKVTLVGDKMSANVATTGVTDPTNGFTDGSVTVSPVALSIGTTPVANPLGATGSIQTVTASVTFEFLATTANRVDVNKSYNFNNVAFQLTQQVTAPGLADAV